MKKTLRAWSFQQAPVPLPSAPEDAREVHNFERTAHREGHSVRSVGSASRTARATLQQVGPSPIHAAQSPWNSAAPCRSRPRRVSCGLRKPNRSGRMTSSDASVLALTNEVPLSRAAPRIVFSIRLSPDVMVESAAWSNQHTHRRKEIVLRLLPPVRRGRAHAIPAPHGRSFPPGHR